MHFPPIPWGKVLIPEFPYSFYSFFCFSLSIPVSGNFQILGRYTPIHLCQSCINHFNVDVYLFCEDLPQ